MSNKLKRNLCFALSLLFSFVIPATVVVVKYDMIEAFTSLNPKIQVSIIGCVILLVLALCNIKKITEFINSIEFSVWKCLVSGTFKIIPLACVLLLLTNMDIILDDLTYITYWILGCNVFSLFIFDPLWRYYNEEVKYDIEHNARRKRELNDKA